ncbi:MAG: ABC transporter ATP-binding protein [Clostridia bacterium]|nr:ABC transporter ATP-binding protein [Clostridia bacterium]
MIKKLAKSVREFKTPSILTSVFVILEVILEVLIPYFTADLINSVYASNMSGIIKTGILLVLMALIALSFGLLSGVFCAKASSGFAKNLRKDMFYKIQDFSFYNIDKFSATSLVTRLTTDVNFVQMAYQMIIRVAIRSPLMLVFSLVMTFTINVKLGLIFLIAGPILLGGLILVFKKVHPTFIKVIKEYDDLNNVVQENVRGARVVKAYVRGEHEIEKFGKTSNLIYKDYSKARKLLALNSPLMQFTVYTCMILVCFIGARLIVMSGGTELTTGQLTTMFTYTMQILMSLMMFSMVIVNIAISRASAERIIEILDEVPNISSPENAITNVKNGEINFENVSFSYNQDISKLCLKDVNLHIKSGQTIGILGGTGSSKSTLISLIPRLYDATMGKVSVGGVDVKQYDIKALRDAVSVVLQKNVLFSGTIKENLKWGNENATDKEIEHACKLACADEFIQRFPDKYDTHIEQGGTNVSGGQKQRLCIARALLKKPKILILDDSTSAVDTKTDAMIRKSFKEEIPNTTKIIIAQRVASVMDADKIVILEGGKILATGTHKELLKSCEVYKEIYTSQTNKGGKK